MQERELRKRRKAVDVAEERKAEPKELEVQPLLPAEGEVAVDSSRSGDPRAEGNIRPCGGWRNLELEANKIEPALHVIIFWVWVLLKLSSSGLSPWLLDLTYISESNILALIGLWKIISFIYKGYFLIPPLRFKLITINEVFYKH